MTSEKSTDVLSRTSHRLLDHSLGEMLSKMEKVFWVSMALETLCSRQQTVESQDQNQTLLLETLGVDFSRRLDPAWTLVQHQLHSLGCEMPHDAEDVVQIESVPTCARSLESWM